MPNPAPLQEQTIDVPLTPLNQTAPTSQGPLGRLRRLVNAQVTKYTSPKVAGDVTTLVAEKRPAFVGLSATFLRAADGQVSSATLANPSVTTSIGDQLVTIAGSKPVVRSELAYETTDYLAPAHVLRESVLYASTSQIEAPDHATVGDVTCSVWYESSQDASGSLTGSNGVRVTVTDRRGTVLRAVSTFSNSTFQRARVVDDGSRFWVFFDDGGNGGGSQISVVVIDPTGATLGTTTVNRGANRPMWDVVNCDDFVLLAFAAGSGAGSTAGATMWRFTYSSGIGAFGPTTNTAIKATVGNNLQFARNPVFGTAKAYLATDYTEAGGLHSIYAYELDRTSWAITNTYPQVAASIDPAVNVVSTITGYVPDGTTDLQVAYSTLNVSGPTPMKSVTTSVTVPRSGSASVFKTLPTCVLSSRAQKIGEFWYAVVYYQSVANFQPCFFLMPLAHSQVIAGRFEFGLAVNDWQKLSGNRMFCLSSMVVASDGSVRVPLGFRAESFTSRVNFNAGFDVPDFVNTPQNTVGVKTFSFGPDFGQPAQFANELILPGPIATSYAAGAFSEHGISLGFEQPSISATTGSLPAGNYEWIALAEWTDPQGNRVRSIESPSITNTGIAGVHAYTISGYMVDATNKPNLTVSLYRTALQGSTQSSDHYKVTSDITPVYNSVGGANWSFTDNVDNTTAALGEILPSDKGLLTRYPCPPHRAGDQWDDRLYVVGYDNTVWFSGSKTEGDALWFHPAFRIVLPTTDEIVNVRAVDAFLLIICKNSLWYVERSTLPDNTGANGDIPTPHRLPFPNGGLGPAVTVREGVAYASSAGSVWLVTRDLQNKWIGRDAADDLTGTITSMTVDSLQRVHCTLTGTNDVVFDTVTGVWYRWSTPTGVVTATTWRGQVTYCDGLTTWQLTPGSYVDAGPSGSSAIQTTIEIAPVHFGGIRKFNRVWAIQMEGQIYSPHILTVQLSYDDEPDSIVTTYTADFTDTTLPYQYEFGPEIEECSSIGLIFSDTYDLGAHPPGQGFALELVTFVVGVESGAARVVPSTNRISS